jgi:hypothetical protein
VCCASSSRGSICPETARTELSATCCCCCWCWSLCRVRCMSASCCKLLDSRAAVEAEIPPPPAAAAAAAVGPCA